MPWYIAESQKQTRRLTAAAAVINEAQAIEIRGVDDFYVRGALERLAQAVLSGEYLDDLRELTQEAVNNGWLSRETAALIEA